MTAVGLSIQDRFDQVQVNEEGRTYQELSISDTVSLAVRMLQIARYIGSTSKQMLNNVKGHAVVGVLKLTTIATLPFALYEIAESVYNVAKTTLNEKVDLVLGTVSTIGGALDVVANIGEGVSAIGFVASTTVMWATPLNIAAVVIESVGMFLITKSDVATVGKRARRSSNKVAIPLKNAQIWRDWTNWTDWTKMDKVIVQSAQFVQSIHICPLS